MTPGYQVGSEVFCSAENPKTLEDLSQEYNVSRERIRQIETRAFEKLQEIVKNKAIELKIV